MDEPLVAESRGGESVEVAEIRRRLAFYEEFDRIIQENVSRSGDLLRLAAERQAQADRAAVVARQELERATDRHRETLGRLLEEVRALGDAVAAVSSRISAALESTAGLPTVQAARRPASEEAPAAASIPIAGHHLGSEVRQAVVVHGLADVTQARSLVDHLRLREPLDTVEPKEFVGGILRLAVSGRGSVRREDVSEWFGGAVEVAEEGRDTLILRLPSAPTL